jgi:hypothetical protein
MTITLNSLSKIDLWQSSQVSVLFGFALLIRVFMLSYLFINPANMFANTDSRSYHKLAVSILHHGKFSTEPTIENIFPDYVRPVNSVNYALPLTPDAFRTPGYPGFLASVYAFGGTPYTAVLIQSLLSLLLVWLVMLFALRLFGKTAAIMAGALAAIDPLSLIYSHEIMSDTPFVFMVAATTVTFFHWVLESTSETKITLPLLSGIFLGLTVLIRPVAMYLPILFIIYAVLYYLSGEPDLSSGKPFDQHRKSLHRSEAKLAKRVIFFLLAAVVTVSSWITRNYLVFDRVFVSTASKHVLFITAISQMVAETLDPYGLATTQEIRDVLEAELVKQMANEGLDASSPTERVAYFHDWSLHFIKSHPRQFASYMLKSAPSLFVSDITGMYQLLGYTREATGSWGILFRSGPKAALNNYFGSNWPVWVAASIPMILFDILVYVLAFFGGIRLLRNRSYFLFSFFVLMIAYWTALSAIASMPRYRFPMMPFLICLGTCPAVKKTD